MRLLVLRFSAMGDVALTVPVLRGVLENNPELELTMVSNSGFAPMFHDIGRLTFHGINLKDYGGFGGLYKLFGQLKALGPWDAVIDIHSVMRTWALGSLFKAAKIPVYKINKGRKEKKALVQHKNKVFKPLKHSTERYLEVFNAFGVAGEVVEGDVIHVDKQAEGQLEQFLQENGIQKDKKWLGIAPFSLHNQKTWPLARVNELLEQIAGREDYQVFLLGGPGEAESLQNLSSLYPNCLNMAGVLPLAEEIALMHKLDVVVAMDSFNMHLAALCGTKVISIWGGTHPYAGFGPLNGNDRFIVQIPHEELPCRPCSVFGSKPCYRKDLACLEEIAADKVMELL